MARRAWMFVTPIILCYCLGPARAEDSIVKARPLPLNSVRLTGGPLRQAQDLDAKYLLQLQPDRTMAYLRREAGLVPKAEGYGGWDGPGRQLTGHIAGHYLSAVSLMWAATGDARFKERAAYLVRELKEVQDRHGDGYIGALKDAQNVSGKTHFEELSRGIIRSSGFDLNGLWSPWYVQHKIYAGLRDAYRLTGDRTALEVEIRFATWAEKILARLDDPQIQQMLNTEFGGMNEVTADLYADTGDKRWLALSDKFRHHAIVDALAHGNDILAGKHGNTLVPKLMGHLARFIYTGDTNDGDAARFFWDRVARHHSFATGGHGKNEYFGEADKLNDMVGGRTAETCNVYNMLKMTRALFSIAPDVRYADFQERALFNHILGSMDPEDGRTCYMVPVGRGVQHEYQDMSRDFTCCVGTGMESHALHGYGIYFESGDRLWVNLYVPSTAEWTAAGVNFEMSTSCPEGQLASLKITRGQPRKFTLALRRPYWAGLGFGVRVNGRTVGTAARNGYVEIPRTWKTGDRVDLELPKALRMEPVPDNPRRIALMWGPLVLAGDLGPELKRDEEDAPSPVPDTPVFLSAGLAPEQWLKPVAGKSGAFVARTALNGRVEFVPFYRLHRRLYGIYWDVFTPGEWQEQTEARTLEAERQRKLESATVAFVQPGEIQAGGDFNLEGESSPVKLQGRHGRRAPKWFSLELPVDAGHSMCLIATYGNDEQQKRTFDILVEGRQIGQETIERRSPEKDTRFFDVTYSLPPELIAGKAKARIRFEATNGGSTGAVFGLRMIRAEDRAR